MQRIACVLLVAGCGSERTWGVYEKGRLVLPTGAQAVDIAPGDHLVLTFVHTSTPPGCASERMRQTEVHVELPGPADHVDLATVPVVFAYGGQRASFRSTDCRGRLSLSPGFAAAIDVTCHDASTGEDRTFESELELRSRY